MYNATAGVRKAAGSPVAQPAGILKAGWLRRHRTQRPAVAAVLVERDAGAQPEAHACALMPCYAVPLNFPDKRRHAATHSAKLCTGCPCAACDVAAVRPTHRSGGRPLGLGVAGVPTGRYQSGSQVSRLALKPRRPCRRRARLLSCSQAWVLVGPSPCRARASTPADCATQEPRRTHCGGSFGTARCNRGTRGPHGDAVPPGWR